MRALRIVDALELAAAYAGAEYAVVMDGDALPLRVGRPASDLEAYLPARSYALITAWNPASIPHSDAANESANAALVARLDAAGIARQPAQGYSSDGQWREPGWLLFDVGEMGLDLLAREFGQAGVLAWSHGQPVRLRMQLSRPERADELSCVDWALD
ncbi:DUF3293 domain-containing protein [Agrilutibacter solisilvae]|uniref:DUF3293 domain-containing protein n=1 Tax=Agrilutibacter solisilvae TaxID=2763317 RepID=A0A975ARV5_9GAMM|nr:DUF3293 domain-containing protein [Lysobacter solisilvae]QSX78097.1 DUF3293 domain-containing protein [Lysobacter solisilvae]